MNPVVALFELLTKKHGGKTVSISAVLTLTVLLVEAGFIEPPIPATRAYVDAKITQATKGLPYLVNSRIEQEVDGQWYLVICMQHYEYQGALNRLVIQYRDLVGEIYKEKSCVQLEAMRLAKPAG